MQEVTGQVPPNDSTVSATDRRESRLGWMAGGRRRSGASVAISFGLHGGVLLVTLGMIFSAHSPKRAEGIEVTFSPDVFVATPEPITPADSSSLADDIIAQVQADSQATAQTMTESLATVAAESIGVDHDERTASLVRDGRDAASAQSELLQSALAESESAAQGQREMLAGILKARKGQFCGIPLGDARKIVYLLDYSGSMDRILAAVEGHLAETIDSLDASKQFHVMYFSSGEPLEMPGKALRPATPARKKLARQFLQSIRAGSGTDPTDALVRAFSLKPDVIYLLSDGQFSDDIFDFVLQGNPNQRVTVNTICFGNRGGQVLMKAIAEANSGRFRLISF